MKRVTLVTTILGSIFLVGGALLLVSAIAGGSESDARSAGLLLMSFGGMVIAIPLYIEARKLQSDRLENVIQRGKTRGAARCAGCGMDTAAFWCTTHQLRLCADCVPRHDEPNRCLYKSLVHTTAKVK